ncbi:MAG: hypothetical protein RIS94_109 [Pseudomonadota bacterium]|jgi:phasin family protein
MASPALVDQPAVLLHSMEPFGMMEEAKQEAGLIPEAETAVPAVAAVEEAAVDATPAPVVVEAPAPVEAGTVVPSPEKKKAGRPRKDAVKVEDKPVVAPVAKAPALKVKSPKEKSPKVRAVKAKAAKPAPAPRKTPTVAPAKPVPVVRKTRVISAAAPARGLAPAPRKEQFKMATTTTEFTEKFQSAFKDASEKAKAAFEKSQANLGDASEFAKGNVEAIVASGKIFAAGLQELSKGYVAESKAAVESLSEELKGLTSVKSPTEFFEKQSALLRKQFDAAVAVSSKNSEAMLKLATEAFQPISTRVSLAVEKMKQAA